ncbi:hypothetical protein CRUP_019076 [Coryphaenoides rupestris]|nr:hypothetical protein CRUP_019076 [Coryphaenoides rupestris]
MSSLSAVRSGAMKDGTPSTSTQTPRRDSSTSTTTTTTSSTTDSFADAIMSFTPNFRRLIEEFKRAIRADERAEIRCARCALGSSSSPNSRQNKMAAGVEGYRRPVSHGIHHRR